VSTIDKGNRWRRKVVLFLEGLGFSVTVRGIGFAGDDLKATLDDLDLSVECKDHVRYDLAGWVRQAELNAEGGIPVVFAHRKGRQEAEDGYVLMSGAAFARLVGSRDDIDFSIDKEGTI
jgi:hypothetical protein